MTGSGYWIQENCYASSQMRELARKSGQLARDENEYAESGSRQHSAMAGYPVALSAQEREEVEQMRTRSNGFRAYGKAYIEERLYLRSDALAPIYSGQPDLVFMAATGAYFQDFKFGKGDNIWPKWIAQRRAYAVLIAEEYGASDVTGTIIPLHGAADTFHFDAKTLAAERETLKKVINEHDKMDAVPTPGDWCRFCQGRLVCPAARASVLDDTLPAAVDQRSLLPRGTDGASLIDKLKRGIVIAKDILDWYEEQITRDPMFVEGEWVMKPGRSRAYVTDPAKGLEKLSRLLSFEEQSACVTLHIGKLREIYSKKYGDKVEKVLAGLIEYRITKATLEKRDPLYRHSDLDIGSIPDAGSD